MKKNVDDFGLDQKDDTNYGTIFEVKFNESGNTYTVLEDGTILTEEEVENNDKLPKLLKENNIVLEVGETKTIEVIENDNIESVDWKNYDENIVTMVKDTTSNNKKINITGKAVGTVNIEAIVNIKTGDKTTVSRELCTVTVKEAYSDHESNYVEKVKLDETELVIDLSISEKTRQLTATVEPGNVKTTFTWSSSNPDVATVNEKGLVTGISNGVALVTVETKNKKKAQCKVIVETNPTQVILDNTEITLDITDYPVGKIKATVLAEDAMHKDVTWSTSDSSKVSISSDEDIVTLTALENTYDNPIEITASTANGRTAVCKVTVVTSPTSVSVSPAEVTLDTGDYKDYQLTSKIYPDTANANTQVTWSSSNNNVATVNSKTGKVTLKDYGVVIITGTTQNGRSSSCTMNINTKIRQMELEPKKLYVRLEETKALTPKVSPEHNNDTIKWISSDNNIATVDSKGNVTGVSKGTTTITAKNSDETVVATATVIVAKTQYGWYVKNYTAKGDSSAKWKAFYEDENNVYLISDTCINIKNIPIVEKGGIFGIGKVTLSTSGSYSASLGNASENYSGLISGINATAKSWLSYSMNSSNNNTKYVGYLMDTEKWTEKYGNDTFAEFAIGGPTIELYLASWNSFDIDNMYCDNTNGYGYYIGASKTEKNTTRQVSEYKNQLYYPGASNLQDYNGYWLASPSAAGANNVLYVGCLNTRNCNNNDYFGFRPVVCLKSNYQLEQLDNEEAYNIVPK